MSFIYTNYQAYIQINNYIKVTIYINLLMVYLLFDSLISVKCSPLA